MYRRRASMKGSELYMLHVPAFFFMNVRVITARIQAYEIKNDSINRIGTAWRERYS